MQYENAFFEQNKIMDRIRESFSGEERFALVETYGCQQNVNDSQKFEGMLMKMGYTLTKEREKADFILFNTCAVRENAEKKVFGNLGALKHLKAKKPSLIIAVCGCMTQQKDIAEKIKAKYRHVDMIFGTGAQDRFPAMLEEALEKNEKIMDLSRDDRITEGIPTNYDGGKGVCLDNVWLQQLLHILHSAVCARAREKQEKRRYFKGNSLPRGDGSEGNNASGTKREFLRKGYGT